MEWLKDNISVYLSEIVIGLAIFIMIILAISIVQGVKIRKIKDRYNSLVRGMNGIDIEGLIIKTNGELMDIKRDLSLIDQNVSQIETKLSFAIQRIGFIRYNAFPDIGSELSFSIALLDQYQNGFVITSIFGRESSVSYAKPMKNGKSNIPLSAEELIAIDRAIKGEGVQNV
jgi:hypothetical protein